MPGKHYAFLRTVVVVYYRPNKVSLQIIIMGGERVILLFALVQAKASHQSMVPVISQNIIAGCLNLLLMVFVSAYLIEFT